MPGFSFLITLLMGLAAWSVRTRSGSVIAGGLLAGLVMTMTGLGVDAGWLLNLGLVVVTLSVGVALGRTLPARSAPLAVLLGVLSAADIIWIASGGGLATGWLQDVANLSLHLGASSSSIGTLDLVLAAAIATHWLRRGTGVPLAVAAAPIGMAIANVYVAATGAGNVALVPFLSVGWLMTEGWHYRSTRHRARGAL